MNLKVTIQSPNLIGLWPELAILGYQIIIVGTASSNSLANHDLDNVSASGEVLVSEAGASDEV